MPADDGDENDQVSKGHLVNALACTGDEGRSRAAISHGEPRAGFDPWISEWGNPTVKVIAHRIHKCAKRTRGTETSKYPEERTSTETPSVAASERGSGQCRTSFEPESSGKESPSG